MPTSFNTTRLLARLPIASDARHIFSAYASKPEVSRYMMWRAHTEVATTEAFITQCIAAAREETRFPYVLLLRERMPEAIAVVASQALSQAAFYRVQAFCDVENIPSQRALEKAGFEREGRHERFIVHPNLSTEPRSCYMYAECR